MILQYNRSIERIGVRLVMNDIDKVLIGSTKNIQHRVFRNKINKGFNTSNVDREICLAYGELAEAFEAYRTKSGNVGEELADVAIYLLGIAEMLDLNLGYEIDKKIEINEGRAYSRDCNGVMKKCDDGKTIEQVIEYYFPDGLK